METTDNPLADLFKVPQKPKSRSQRIGDALGSFIAYLLILCFAVLAVAGTVWALKAMF